MLWILHSPQPAEGSDYGRVEDGTDGSEDIRGGGGAAGGGDGNDEGVGGEEYWSDPPPRVNAEYGGIGGGGGGSGIDRAGRQPLTGNGRRIDEYGSV